MQRKKRQLRNKRIGLPLWSELRGKNRKLSRGLRSALAGRQPLEHESRNGQEIDYRAGTDILNKSIIQMQAFRLLHPNLRRTWFPKKKQRFEQLSQMEARLDTVLFRAGFTASLLESRNLITCRAVSINGAVCTRPSRQTRMGDLITISDKMVKILQQRIRANLNKHQYFTNKCSHLEPDYSTMTILVVMKPNPSVLEYPGTLYLYLR